MRPFEVIVCIKPIRAAAAVKRTARLESSGSVSIGECLPLPHCILRKRSWAARVGRDKIVRRKRWSGRGNG